MRHKELTNHIQGSFLKRQFLEAFLVQSAYIESLLKLYLDLVYFTATDRKSYDNIILNTLRKNIGQFGLSQLIRFLYDADLINKPQRNLLNSYKDSRNRIMHNLIREIRRNNFEKELEDVCKMGTQIIEDEKFKDMAELLDRFSDIQTETPVFVPANKTVPPDDRRSMQPDNEKNQV